MSALAGFTVTITITQRASWSSDFGVPRLDNVALDGAGGDLAIINGTFDTDLGGWTIAPQAELQNVTTANAAITATVSYLSDLGSDGGGVVFPLNGTAVWSWDLRQSDPDVGFVFGSGAALASASASGTRNAQGAFDITSAMSNGDLASDEVQATYEITVAPGATISLAVFTIMSPVRTGDRAANSNAHPALVESTIAAIEANVTTDGQYFTGMTQAQIDSLANF